MDLEQPWGWFVPLAVAAFVAVVVMGTVVVERIGRRREQGRRR